MNPTDLLSVVALSLVGAASPGPDVILLLRTATRSRKHAYVTSLGIHLGAFMWISLTVLGAAALLNAFPGALRVVQVVGGALLLYMGQSVVRAGLASRRKPAQDLVELERSLGSLRRSFGRGLATNLSNPKIVLFLAALIAPILPPNPNIDTAIVLIASLTLSSLALFFFISTVVSTRRVRDRLLRASWVVDLVAGSLFLFFGSVLVIKGFGLVG